MNVDKELRLRSMLRNDFDLSSADGVAGCWAAVLAASVVSMVALVVYRFVWYKC
jgi:hypothetical protein